MRLVEKKGPFSKNSSFRVGSGSLNTYVHVGIQKPKSQPLSANWRDVIPKYHGTVQDTYPREDVYTEAIQPDVQVQTNNDVSNYYINRAGILEFDVAMGTTVRVTFLKDMPPETIVDLVYDEDVM